MDSSRCDTQDLGFFLTNFQNMKPPRQIQDCEDLFERRLVQAIEQRGFGLVHQPGHCYTVGLWKTYNHPELIIFSLPAERAQLLLEQAVEKIGQGQQIATFVAHLAVGYALRVESVQARHHREFLSYNRWFYRGDDFQACQLVWPDADHNFPDHPAYRGHELQPQLQ